MVIIVIRIMKMKSSRFEGSNDFELGIRNDLCPEFM